jgi:hypothetical protein
MTTFSLSYNGQKLVESNVNQQAHELLDALLTLHESDSAITVDIGQARPQGSNLLLLVSLSSHADMTTLDDAEQSLAQSLIDLGIEPDIETATESIQIRNR